jgi:hypothetical protein
MKWITALLIAALVAVVLPTGVDLRSGVWMDSWASTGTIRPHAGSPGLLFSIPVFIGLAIFLRTVFNWHSR